MPTIAVEVRQVEATPTSEGIARTHRVLIDRPKDKGGLDRGPLGGELLLLAWGGCFMSNLMAAAKARELSVSGLKVVVQGELGDAPAHIDSAIMEVYGASSDEEAFLKVIQIAERGCLVTNTLRRGIRVEVRRQPRTGS